MTNITCTDCGEQLSSQTDPCPKCGSAKKTIGVLVADAISVTDAFHAIVERKFWETNWRYLAPYVLINLLSPFTGLLGPYGVVAGFVLNIFSFFLGLGAVKRIIERDRLSSQM